MIIGGIITALGGALAVRNLVIIYGSAELVSVGIFLSLLPLVLVLIGWRLTSIGQREYFKEEWKSIKS